MKDYLLVDGYNIIFAWNNGNIGDNIDAEKEKLINILCNYQGIKKINVILVFDAYKVSGGVERVETIGGIYVVHTKEAETADSYIERTTHELTKQYNVTVATSDGLEQAVIMGKGALRMSAKDLYEQVHVVKKEINTYIDRMKPAKNNMLVDNLDKEAANFLEDLRRKK